MRGDTGERDLYLSSAGLWFLEQEEATVFPVSRILVLCGLKLLSDHWPSISGSKLLFPTTASLKLPPSKFEGFSLSVLFHICGIWVTKSACSLQTASPLPYYSWLRSSNNKHLTSGMPFPFGLLSRLPKGLQFIWTQGNQLPQGSRVNLVQDWSPPLTFSLLRKKIILASTFSALWLGSL